MASHVNTNMIISFFTDRLPRRWAYAAMATSLRPPTADDSPAAMNVSLAQLLVPCVGHVRP